MEKNKPIKTALLCANVQSRAQGHRRIELEDLRLQWNINQNLYKNQIQNALLRSIPFALYVPQAQKHEIFDPDQFLQEAGARRRSERIYVQQYKTMGQLVRPGRVAASPGGPVSSIGGQTVQYLVPDFFAAAAESPRTGALAMRISSIAQEMVQAAISSEDPEKRSFFVNKSFKDVVAAISAEMEAECSQREGNISQQLRKIANVYNQFLVDPRVISEDIINLLLKTLNMFQEQISNAGDKMLKLSPEDQLEIEKLVTTSLKLLLTLDNDKTTIYLMYIQIHAEEGKSLFIELKEYLRKNFDFANSYYKR